MNCTRPVSSATSGALNCRRTTTRSKTIVAHCQRVRRNRSSRSVRTNSLCGAKPSVLGDSARARKQATAKNPASNDSISNACILMFLPRDTPLRSRLTSPDSTRLNLEIAVDLQIRVPDPPSEHRAQATALTAKVGSHEEHSVSQSNH